MTIQDAIEKIQLLRNDKILSTDFIIEKINEIEWKIKKEIIDIHEGSEKISFDGYSSDEMNKSLIASSPYSELYIKWVLYQADIANNSIIDAANSQALFNKEYNSFSLWYKKNNKPVSRGNISMTGYHI